MSGGLPEMDDESSRTPAPVLAPELAAALPGGGRIGRYTLEAFLGAGGAASVYLGRARGIGGFQRKVAIKILHPHLRQDAAFVRDFLREARLAAGMRHPNVVSVLDVGDAPEGVFFVMDDVEGVSLAALRTRAAGRIPEAIALRALCDGLAGLHAAHELTDETGSPLGLVHRDVSPQNLLVDRHGVTRLADFGIAKVTSAPTLTSSGVVKGKLPYMAPEQVRGRAIDRRTDLFAAGVVAWELLAGKRLFEGEDEMVVLMRLATETMPSLRTARADLPPALVAAVDRALATAPDERFATAEALAEALAAGAAPLGGLADAKAVGAFVTEVAAEDLAKRVRPLSAVVPALARTSTTHAAHPDATTVAAAPATKGRASLLRTARIPLLVGAVTALALSVVWLGRPTPPPTTTPEAPPAAAAPAPAPRANEPTPPAQPKPPVTTATPSTRAPVRRSARPARDKKRAPEPPMADNPYQ